MNIANTQGQVFSVYRASEGIFSNNKPCEEAVRWEDYEPTKSEQSWYLPSFCFNDIGWFIKRCGHDVVISDSPISDHAHYEIEIYDYYRE